jgi:hypothetical protein
LGWLDGAGIDEGVLFPNFRAVVGASPVVVAAGGDGQHDGLESLVRAEGGGRLHPITHLKLRDPK